MKTTLTALACATIISVVAQASAQEHEPTAVRVHVTGDVSNVTIEQREGKEWFPVCEGPCDRRLTTGQAYRVSGDGVTASKLFVLEGPDDVQLQVSPGHSGLHLFGVILIPVGAVALELGFDLLVVGALTQLCSDCVSGYANTTTLNVGWTMIGAGAAALIAALVIVPSTRTKVTASSIVSPAPAFVRVRDPEARATPTPAMTGLPIVNVTF